MDRRVHFAPGTKNFNRIPEWFSKPKPSYSSDVMHKRIAVKELIGRIDRLIYTYQRKMRRARNPGSVEQVVQHLAHERAGLVKKLHMLQKNV